MILVFKFKIMRDDIFTISEKILNIPINESKSNKYKNMIEYRNIIYSIWIYLYKKYGIKDNIIHNPENNKLVDFLIKFNTEEIPKWSYELTQTYKHTSNTINNWDFYILLKKIIDKKWMKEYIIRWKKWLIVNSYNMWVNKINQKEVLDFFDNFRNKINFDIVIFSAFIWDKEQILTNIYHKKSRLWYTIILKGDKSWKDINILEDTKFFFENNTYLKRI